MILLFDIGGTMMRFARADTKDTFSNPVIVETPATYEDAIGEACQILTTLAKTDAVDLIVGGVAGTLDPKTGTLFASPNMKQWIGKPLLSDIKRITGATQVVIKNDADLAGLGEAVFGAGKPYAYVAYVTVSTGVGGSFVANKQLFETRYSPEPGHQIINDQLGETLEHVVGGRSLEKKYGKKPKELGEIAYDHITTRLAIGLHNVVQFWAPDVVVLGGSQMRDISVEVLHREIKRLNVMYPYVPDVLVSTLGTVNGLYGALAYATSLETNVHGK